MNERHSIHGAAVNERSHVIDGAAVSARAHVIEIDSIVLHVAHGARPRRLAGLIEGEVGRVLGKSTLPDRAIAHPKHGVAGEIARTVVRAVGAAPHGA